MEAAMLKKLEANDVEMEAWVEALKRVANYGAPAAAAIRKHIDALVDNRARILELPESEIAEINKQAEAAVEAQMQEEAAAFWAALETAAPPEVMAKVKKLLGDMGVKTNG